MADHSGVIAVLTPVLNRPKRVAPLIESLRATSTVTRCRMVFIATANDKAERAALQTYSDAPDVTVLTVPPSREGYARKINYGFKHTTEPFVFTAADDLDFQPGWAEYALAAHLETGACVVGTNDGGHTGTADGTHSTHFLICREYGECGLIDDETSGKIMWEGYGHWYPDAELIATAKYRETYAHASLSMIEHLHPNWGKSKMDATYEKGHSTISEDRMKFTERKKLWQ